VSITVAPVRSRADLREFVRLPLRLHPRDRYVPLWAGTVRDWHRGVGPHTRFGDVRLVLARDAGGHVVGRATLQTDRRMDDKLAGPTLLLGAVEAADGAALRAITGHARSVAVQEGRGSVFGPCSLLPNQTGGVITSGFEERGFLDSPWNPSWVPAAWEEAGFEPVLPAATWVCEDLGSLDPDAVFPRGQLEPGLQLRRGDRRRLEEQLPLLRAMLNASFAELPYYTRIEADELAAATDGLSHLLDESLLLFVTRGEEPLAFVLTVPDLSEFVMGTGGSLGLLDQLRLLATRGRYRREAILIIKGTVPQARGLGLMSVLSRELLRNLQAGGYERLRVTFVGEENAASAAQFRAMGGRPLHGLTFYRAAVA
jgi:hypothetical protein